MQRKFYLAKEWFVSSKRNDINEDYLMMSELGAGAYGKVYLSQDKRSLTYRAIKVIQKVRVEDYTSFTNEIDILKKLDHPNIVNIIETYENDRVCCLVLEYCRGGELFDKIAKLKTFTEAQASAILKQLLSAVMYCHDHNICHRDLKPENCLYINEDEGSEIKVIDFGLSASVKEEDVLHDVIGTPYYIAPEMLSSNYTKEVDCWSLGVIMYMMLSGSLPFRGKDNHEILMNVYNGSFTFRNKNFKQVSNGAKDLICRFLTKDPVFRITARQAYMHPWVQGTVVSPFYQLPSQIIDSIRRFNEANAIKKAAFMFVASKLTERDIVTIRANFKAIDTNGDGVLNKADLFQVVKNQRDIGDENLNYMLSALDANNNGIVDYTEFITGCLLRKTFSTTGFLESAFMFFDKDNSGKITVEEVMTVLLGDNLVHGISLSQFESMVKDIDKDDDGCIDYKEFIEMMAAKL